MDRANGRIEFNNFTVVKRSDYYFSVLDAFGQEVTSGKSFDNAAKKAKLLQIGFNMGKDRYMNWLWNPAFKWGDTIGKLVYL